MVTVTDGQAYAQQTIVVNVSAQGGSGGDTWNVNTIYNTGDTAVYNGITYTAQWWAKGETPGTSSVWVEEDSGEVGSWSASKIYNGGDEVTFDGNSYHAKWWTKGDKPGNDNGPWEQI